VTTKRVGVGGRDPWEGGSVANLGGKRCFTKGKQNRPAGEAGSNSVLSALRSAGSKYMIDEPGGRRGKEKRTSKKNGLGKKKRETNRIEKPQTRKQIRE